jgi:hypothetical protein
MYDEDGRNWISVFSIRIPYENDPRGSCKISNRLGKITRWVGLLQLAPARANFMASGTLFFLSGMDTAARMTESYLCHGK